MYSPLTPSETDVLGDASVLITFHGTIVYFDTEKKVLLHGRIGDCAVNVFLIRENGSAYLVYYDENKYHFICDFNKHGCGVFSGITPPKLAEIPLGSNLVCFIVNGRYLCAESNNQITCGRCEALTWESFYPLSLVKIHRLENFLKSRWLIVSINRVYGPNDYHIHERYNIQIGHINVSLNNLIEGLCPLNSEAGFSKDFFLSVEHWKVERLVLFRPLVYLVAYGSDDIFELAALSISSLINFGEWNSDILLISDRDANSLAHIFSEDILSRVRFLYMSAYETLDIILNRYKIIDLDFVKEYQPVVYLDTDVLCDRPIEQDLHQFVISKNLHVVHDSPMAHPGNWYGQDLLIEDGAGFDPNAYGVSSGTFIFRHVHDQGHFFNAVINTAYKYLRYNKYPHRGSDQAIFNYILCKSKLGTTDFMDGLYHLYMNHHPIIQAPLNKGFVHFAGGIGNSSPKLDHMKAYYNVLRHEKDQSDLIYNNIDDKKVLERWVSSKTYHFFVDSKELWNQGDPIDKMNSIEVISYTGSRLAPAYLIPVSNDRVAPRVLGSIEYLDYIYRRGAAYLEELDEKGQYTSKVYKITFQGADCPVNHPSVSWQAKDIWSGVKLIPDLYYFKSRGYSDFLPANSKNIIEWHKRHPTALWRGSTTGLLGITLETLPELPRYQLCNIAAKMGKKMDAGITNLVQVKSPEVHEKIQNILKANNLVRPHMPFIEMAQYKYIVDIDGNASSWNLLMRLRLGCCLLKVHSSWRQWLTDKLVPWEHFVPVLGDLSDLEEKLDWCLVNDLLAREIGMNGRNFALHVIFDDQMKEAARQLCQAAEPVL